MAAALALWLVSSAAAPTAGAAVDAGSPGGVARGGPAAVQRPRVGLVLGGSSARALAHLGVLQVLDELRVPVDCISAVSFGAIIGGLYASGLPPARIAAALDRVDWANLSGGDLGLLLHALVRPVDREGPLSGLPIPFTSVATDLETGQATLFQHGPLSQAMRASFSIAGWIAPYRIVGRLFTDGGLVDSLPVDVVRQLCADVLVVVDVGRPLASRADLTTAVGQSQQIVTMINEQNAMQQLAALAPHDALIVPELAAVSPDDYLRPAAAIAAGRAAALRIADRLRPLALSAEDYRAHLAARAARRNPGPPPR